MAEAGYLSIAAVTAIHGSLFVAAVHVMLLSVADILVAMFTVVVMVPYECGVARSGRPVARIRRA
jgi:hypothetical protein